MTDRHPAIEPVRNRRARDAIERARPGIVRLVDMEVEIETALAGQPEYAFQQHVVPGIGAGHRAQHTAAVAHQIGDLSRVVRVGERPQWHQRHRLEGDPSAPFLADLAEDRPGDRVLRGA